MRHSLRGCMLWAWVCPSCPRVRNNPRDPTGKPQPKEMQLAPVLPQSRKQVSWGQGFQEGSLEPGRAPGQVCAPPQHKDTPVRSQMGALAPTEYPQVWQGKDQPSPQGRCGSRPLSGWSGLPPGRDMTQGGLPFPGQGRTSSSPPTGCLGPSNPERVSTPGVGGAAGTVWAVGGQEGCLIEVGKLEGPSVG